MVSKFIFNRRKKDTIILLHGLYTNSGFWLSFLKLFTNFKIIAFNIEYEKILYDETLTKSLLKNAFKVEDNVVGIISHSFGTVISDLVFENDFEIVHKICPVAFSKRMSSSNFIYDVISKTQYTENSITDLMMLVNAFIAKERSLLNLNGQIYVPSRDDYFSYDVPEKKKIEFSGDHFNINIALENIIQKLPIRSEID